MSKAAKINRFQKAYHSWKDIWDDKDLKKEGITFVDYSIIREILQELSGIDNSEAETISANVVKWFKRFEFQIYPKGIGWSISL